MKNLLILLLTLSLVAACGGSDSESDDSPNAEAPAQPDNPIAPSSLCDQTSSQINQQALMLEDCENLAQYGLFIDPQIPSSDPVAPGMAYQLSTQLFTNYASKYRFIFIPEGKQAIFHPSDTFELPIGTVLTKTFSMPYDTQVTGPENEALIETRLLIHRESGWTTLPYRWQNGEAKLIQAGADIPHTLNHHSEVKHFDYHLPSRAECKLCHQINDGETSHIRPIGLKAHLLNHDIEFNGQTVNQLQLWQSLSRLTGLPKLSDVDHAPALTDSGADLTLRAKGYIDINCAHCHRAEGFASISGLRLGFGVDHTSYQYGICKQPPGWDGGAKGLSYDIVPGDGEHSILLYRQELNSPKDRMPPIGRSLVHTEAIEVIKQWIDSLSPAIGNCHG
ncbi:SO2930 family diheme c-type cytochrome [uncultured Shewanella sp.]|uniref:SO2930 family diheme c-type cytochrome n=1 Tax=Shewanella atlantica TaxID=271099 RepID=UPI002608687D|nr:SO2930 family diheme c-type cytochrome [uncultured Shewanella sp.]